MLFHSDRKIVRSQMYAFQKIRHALLYQLSKYHNINNVSFPQILELGMNKFVLDLKPKYIQMTIMLYIPFLLM